MGDIMKQNVWAKMKNDQKIKNSGIPNLKAEFIYLGKRNVRWLHVMYLREQNQPKKKKKIADCSAVFNSLT